MKIERESNASAAAFSVVEYTQSRWTLSLDTDRIGKLYESFSQIQRLETSARHRLLEQLKRIADTQFGGIVERNVTSCLYLLSR